jgi:hypothetical protein
VREKRKGKRGDQKRPINLFFMVKVFCIQFQIYLLVRAVLGPGYKSYIEKKKK